MYSQIKQLLCERLPRLKELSFGCKVKADYKFIGKTIHGFEGAFIGKIGDRVNCILRDGYLGAVENYEILGHDFSHYDIVEALGVGYSVYSDGTLWHRREGAICKLPSNLHDLDLPKYEETAKRLLELLTNLPK